MRMHMGFCVCLFVLVGVCGGVNINGSVFVKGHPVKADHECHVEIDWIGTKTQKGFVKDAYNCFLSDGSNTVETGGGTFSHTRKENSYIVSSGASICGIMAIDFPGQGKIMLAHFIPETYDSQLAQLFQNEFLSLQKTKGIDIKILSDKANDGMQNNNIYNVFYENRAWLKDRINSISWYSAGSKLLVHSYDGEVVDKVGTAENKVCISGGKDTSVLVDPQGTQKLQFFTQALCPTDVKLGAFICEDSIYVLASAVCEGSSTDPGCKACKNPYINEKMFGKELKNFCTDMSKNGVMPWDSAGQVGTKLFELIDSSDFPELNKKKAKLYEDTPGSLKLNEGKCSS